ncbi:MAG: hypothetical protein MUC78_04220 [Bacteroidales bacterium]|jgi:hypothetical protein|nr:hypothetical protein [Bacteroidales bacterium]
MKRIGKIAGITWAFAGLILIIILFPGLNGFSRALAKMPFMKINPNYTGGEIAFSDSLPGYKFEIRKPVFDGLWKERTHGFVQLDWRGDFPEKISDTIDFDRDGCNDFRVTIDTKTPETDIEPLHNKVGSLNVSTSTSYGWTLRVNISK